ncbi:MAG: 50S ribosomal protein L5 [Candidatus Nealsonbacteria bacterium]
MIASIMEKYKKEVIPGMKERFGLKNNMTVPKITKITVNTGFGKQTVSKTGDERKKFIDGVIEDLAAICGQKPIQTVAKKAIASFKIREGVPLGSKVTLRGKKMYDFLGRLIHLTLPRTRDFKGIDPKGVDKGGNLTIAVKEHIAFPEVLPEKIRNIFGLEATITTTAKNKEEGLELFRLLGVPFKK